MVSELHSWSSESAGKAAQVFSAPNQPLTEAVAVRLKRLRLKSGMTPGELAFVAGIPTATVRSIELGREPSLDSTIRLSVALGVTLGQLRGTVAL